MGTVSGDVHFGSGMGRNKTIHTPKARFLGMEMFIWLESKALEMCNE